jgi:hypothetical protein
VFTRSAWSLVKPPGLEDLDVIHARNRRGHLASEVHDRDLFGVRVTDTAADPAGIRHERHIRPG